MRYWRPHVSASGGTTSCVALVALHGFVWPGICWPSEKTLGSYFSSTDELSAIALNLIFSSKMSCYYCSGGIEKGAWSGKDSGFREAFCKCLQEWLKHHELHVSRVFSIPQGAGVQWSVLLWWELFSSQSLFLWEEHQGWNSCCLSRAGRATKGNSWVPTQWHYFGESRNRAILI